MDQQDPLGLDSLPSDPRENILRLLGMTVSSLKEIDSNISGNPNPYIKGFKLDTKEILNEAITNLTPHHVTQQTQPVVNLPVASGPIQVNPQVPTVQQASIQSLNTPQYDPNQLEFDFYKKIKPEDIENQLKSLNIGIKKINEKLDEIISKLENKKKATKINGN